MHLLLDSMSTKVKILAMKETLVNAIYSLNAQMSKLSAETNVNPMFNLYDPKEKRYVDVKQWNGLRV